MAVPIIREPRSKRWIVGAVELLLGRELRAHRVPFGPNAGRYLYLRPSISLRMLLGIDEPEVARAARRLLRPGDVVYDAGAHVGYLTVLFADRVTASGQVHSFELMPSTAALLRRSVELNRLDHCEIHVVGISDSEARPRLPVKPTQIGTAELRVADDDPRPLEECRVVGLDAYRRERSLPAPTLIKLDVEGSEVKALHGAEATIREHEPLLIVEFHNLQLLLEAQPWLVDRGYSLARLSGEAATPKDIAGLARNRRSFLCHREGCRWHQERLER